MDRCVGGDPYEERLLAVFESCDVEGDGLLDGEGLSRLCRLLELEDRRQDLMSRLVAQSSTPPLVHITFPKFRDALLALLASSPSSPSDDRQPSPVREVSPKFVYGQKKYGRRSRPESTDHDGSCQDITIEEADTQSDTFLVEIKDNCHNGDMCPDSKIIGSEKNGTEEMNNIQYTTTAALNNGTERISDKETDVESGTGERELREAWCRLGFGSDGYLHRNELAMVCSAVGMDTLADQVVAQVFSKLNLDQDGRISFEEFLELFRSRAGSPPSLSSRSPPLHFQPPPSPDGFTKSPSVSSDLWENGGSVGNMNVARVFQELQSVRSVLESVTEERDKLRSDLADANYRAAVLAQEVDEHHARIETATQIKVKLLEQKHAEEVKEIKRQAGCDREQLATVNQKLELEVAQYVDQISRLTSQLTTLQKEYEVLEKENRALSERLQKSEMSAESLCKQLECMEAIHQRVLELETAEECSSGLQEKLVTLQAENTELRDRNDELTTQLELLQTANTRQPQRRENSWDGSSSGGSGGTKRRPPPGGVDWPMSDITTCPPHRRGKLRRYSTDNHFSNNNHTQPTTPIISSTGCLVRQQNSESGLESDFDTVGGSSPTPSNSSLDNGSCGGSTEQEIEHLRAYVSRLESKLDQFQMMKEWELSKVNAHNLSDDDSSLHYATTATVRSESTQAANTMNDSDVMEQKSPEHGNTVSEECSRTLEEMRKNNYYFGVENLISKMLNILSKYEECKMESCRVFKHSVEETLRSTVQSIYLDQPKINGDVLKDDKKYISCRFPFTNSNTPDSIEDYELSEDSEGSGVGSSSSDKMITKFDKLSQFAFEFIDNDNLKTATNHQIVDNRIEECLNVEETTGPIQETRAEDEARIKEHEEDVEMETMLQRLKDENLQLSQRCTDLETSLEMMRVEYEKTEDYWANKLDEERKHFELDQQQSDEKFAELEAKIQEYAEMLSNEQGRKQLLPPIEERDFLEKQFTDLEEEYETYKQAVELELSQKDCDISNLEHALAAATLLRTHNSSPSLGESKTVQVQTEGLEDVEFQQHSVSVDQVDGGCDKRSGWMSGGSSNEMMMMGGAMVDRKELRKTRELRARLNAECDTLIQHKKNLLYQIAAIRASNQMSCREMELVKVLSMKLREQETRCKQLESALRHHQRQSQRFINKEWERHKSDLLAMEGILRLTNEKLGKQTAITKQLWEKLCATDVFVTDLFVKYCKLKAARVRLEEDVEEHVTQNNNNKSGLLVYKEQHVGEQHHQVSTSSSSSLLLFPPGLDNKYQYNSL